MPVLAPEDDSRTMDSLRFSLASDIVELVVLTTDEIFLQTLREAVGLSRRLWHVPSPDKVSDLLLAGGVGILVLDVNALRQPGVLFITQIKHQFPDLVIVVAGARDTETELARLISDGTVYRFIHKPMSPARARLFADAAVKRYEDLRKRTAEAMPAGAKPMRNGRVLIAGGCAAICAIAVGLWALTRSDREPAAPSPAAGPATAGMVSTDTAPARPPSERTTAAPATDSELLLTRAENALLEERLDEAAAAIEMARRAGAQSGRITLLTAELAKARGQIKSAADSARVAAAADGTRSAPDPADASAALAMQRLREGRLVEPEGDSARFYVQEALKSNPGSDATERASEALALGLLNAARSAIDRKDFKAASAWLDAADDIASPANIDNLRHLLAGALPTESLSPAPKTAEEVPSEVGAAMANDAQGNTGEARAPSAADVVDAQRLVIVKSVQPEYPRKAREDSIQGWVELDFTVAVSGQVKDLSVHAANPRGVFDQAAMSALAQWRYKPVLVDAKPVAQRARIRIRFALAN
jgi:TonB family protein